MVLSCLLDGESAQRCADVMFRDDFVSSSAVLADGSGDRDCPTLVVLVVLALCLRPQ